MGNIRKNKENGGVVLSEEEKKKIASIIVPGQSKVDYIMKKNTEKEKDENKENDKKGMKLRGYLTKSPNPQQKIVDEMIKKQQEENEER